MWDKYRVQWDFMTPMYGQTPADPEVVKKWLDTRKANVKAPGAKSIEEINEEVLATINRGEEFEDKECNILVFQRHKGALCARFDTIRAHIKDCSRVLSNQFTGQIKGERAFSTRVINGVYTDPAMYWVPILRADGTPITEHDGEKDKAVHVRGPAGSISALKRLEYIEPGARMDFTLMILTAQGNKPSVAEADLHHIFTYGGVHGYGGERSSDGGKYTYKLERMEDGRAEGEKPRRAVPRK